MSDLWLISVPGESYTGFNNIPSDLATRSEFKLPELKVGTLDSLIQLSDELAKADTYGESVSRKVASYFADILDNDRAQLKEHLKLANNIDPNVWVCQFKWAAEKYPSRMSLPELVKVINTSLTEIDQVLKKKSSSYNAMRSKLAQFEKKSTSSLVTRPLNDIIKPSDLIQNSEYLETLFVTIPLRSEDEWIKSYESITEMIVPRSSKKITEDGEYALYNITLFRRAIGEFKTECSKRRYIVREFEYSEDVLKSDKEAFAQLDQEKRKTYPILFKWLKVNFSEAYSAWIHIKALRIFVESVLRYGLPVNFRAAVIIPGKNQKKLRDRLNQIFESLDSSGGFSAGEMIDDTGAAMKFDSQEYYPYVYCRIAADIIDSI